MSDVLGSPLARVPDRRPNRAPLAAFADGPEPDTAQPLAAEAGRPVTQPDGNHLDAMGHS